MSEDKFQDIAAQRQLFKEQLTKMDIDDLTRLVELGINHGYRTKTHGDFADWLCNQMYLKLQESNRRPTEILKCVDTK